MFCLHSGIINLSLYKHWVNAVVVTFLAVVVAIGAAAAAMAVEVIGVDNCILLSCYDFKGCYVC
jgi:hypothetical protein